MPRWNGFLVRLAAGAGIVIDQSDPGYPTISATGGGGGVESVIAGDNITVDSTDPANPIVSAEAGGGVQSVVAGSSVSVDNTDPANPIIGIQLNGTHLATPTGAYTIGADGTDLVLDASSYYFKLASVGMLILGSLGISVSNGVVFNPGHAPTVSLPDPADHPGGILWDTTTLSLAVSDGTAWKHIAAA